MWDQGSEGWDSPGTRDHKPWDRDQLFHRDQVVVPFVGSAIKMLLGSGIRILGIKNRTTDEKIYCKIPIISLSNYKPSQK